METEVAGIDILGIDDISNVDIDDLVTEDVNLILLGIDCSGSMKGFESAMQEELEKFKNEISASSTADQILVSRTNFSDDTNVSGYKKIGDVPVDYTLGNMTVLYDTIIVCSSALLKYTDELKQQGMRVRAVFAIFSDGEDTASEHSISEAKQAVNDLNKIEVITAYMEFGDRAAGMGKTLGFRSILRTGGSGDDLRHMFGLLTTSVIQHSRMITDDDDFFA